jgi:O-antigen ligase
MIKADAVAPLLRLMINQAKVFRWLRALWVRLVFLMKLLPDWLMQMVANSCSVQLVSRLGRQMGAFRFKTGWRRFKLTSWQVQSIEGIILLHLVLLPVWQREPRLLYGLIYLLYWRRPAGQPDHLGWELPVSGFALALGALLAGAGRGTLGILGEYEASLLLAWLIGRSFTPRFCRKTLQWLLFSSLIWMVIGLGQQLSGVPTPSGWLGPEQVNRIAVRSYGVFSNPNIYAIYLVSIISFAVCWGGADQQKRQRFLYRSILIVAVVSLYFTYSRGGWLLAAVLLGWRLTRSKGFKPWLLYTTVVALLLTLGGFKTRLFGLLAGHDSSVTYRLRIWSGVIQILKANWLWGIGPGNFSQVYPWIQSGTTFSWHAHSFYLQFWLEFGLANLLIAAVLGRKVLLRALRVKGDSAQQAVMLGILCLVGGGFSESWQVSRFCREYCGLLVGLLLALQHRKQGI